MLFYVLSERPHMELIVSYCGYEFLASDDDVHLDPLGNKLLSAQCLVHNCRQKVFNWGALLLFRGIDILKFDKNCTDL